MQEIFAQFPTPAVQHVPVLSGQIFDVRLLPKASPAVPEPQEQVVPPVSLTSLQAKSLEALFIFKQATADLLLRYLRMKPGSLRHLQKQLYALHPKNPADRSVEFMYVPKPQDSPFSSARFGSSPIVYTLGKQGHHYLKKHGFAVGRYRQPDAGVKEEIPLRHRLAVNEFLLKAFQLVWEYPDLLQLFDYRHEHYWNGKPLKVQLPEEEKPKGLSPDLLLAFETFRPPDQRWFPVEINLSREWEKDWITKVRLYRYCMPAYRQRFGTAILTTIPVVIASPSAFPRMLYARHTDEDRHELQREATRRERRMQLFLTWTEKILEELKMRHHADLFSFSCQPLDELRPAELFFGKHWYIPFSDTPRPLLPLDRRAGGA